MFVLDVVGFRFDFSVHWPGDWLERLVPYQNGLLCVEWDVKLCSLNSLTQTSLLLIISYFMYNVACSKLYLN